MARTLGGRIRKARLEYGMSQAELARRIQISTQGMNMIEGGKTADPASSRIAEIARALKVSADYLLGLDEVLPGHLVCGQAGVTDQREDNP